jgi:hypothetical protein
MSTKRIALLSLGISLSVFFISCKEKVQVTPSAKITSLPKKEQVIINPFMPVDVSPMDMAYWPADYPKLHMAGQIKTPPLARVIYSRPQLQGRKIFPEILQYEQLWRLGANEATELQLFKDAEIEGKLIKAGRYTLYCIPHQNTWTIIFNTTTDTWGLREEHATDFARVEVPVTKSALQLEHFTMVFLEKETYAELFVGWGDLETRIRFKF